MVWKRAIGCLAGLVAGAALAGCAADLGEVDREQLPGASVLPDARLDSHALPGIGAIRTEGMSDVSCRAGSVQRMRSSRIAYAATGRHELAAFARPGGPRIAAFGPQNENGYPTVLGVLSRIVDESCRPQWYRVQLPVRPNGTVGYVRARDVALETVRTRIEVDLSERRIDLLRDGERVMRLRAAVGSSLTPTPVGTYYVNQRLVVRDPHGPFGPAALGISAFSPVLQEWTQGGPVAIHGTNVPSSIGEAVSQGCLRVDNEKLLALFDATVAGTPVLIRA